MMVIGADVARHSPLTAVSPIAGTFHKLPLLSGAGTGEDMPVCTVLQNMEGFHHAREEVREVTLVNLAYYRP